MGRCRVVMPETVRLPLSDGDYLDVKKDLNAGEYFDLLLALSARQKFARLVAYLMGWSLVGLDNQPLPYDPDDPVGDRVSMIGALDKATLHEMTAALDRHEAAQDAARDAKKKATTAGTPALSATSRSAA